MHTSYSDVLDLSYRERIYLIEFIGEKQATTQKAIDQLQQQQAALMKGSKK